MFDHVMDFPSFFFFLMLDVSLVLAPCVSLDHQGQCWDDSYSLEERSGLLDHGLSIISSIYPRVGKGPLWPLLVVTW